METEFSESMATKGDKASVIFNIPLSPAEALINVYDWNINIACKEKMGVAVTGVYQFTWSKEVQINSCRGSESFKEENYFQDCFLVDSDNFPSNLWSNACEICGLVHNLRNEIQQQDYDHYCLIIMKKVHPLLQFLISYLEMYIQFSRQIKKAQSQDQFVSFSIDLGGLRQTDVSSICYGLDPRIALLRSCILFPTHGTLFGSLQALQVD